MNGLGSRLWEESEDQAKQDSKDSERTKVAGRLSGKIFFGVEG